MSDNGAALNNCFGFVNGTVSLLCRPGEHQQLVCNRQNRVYPLKFRAAALPNGLIGYLFSPVGKMSYLKMTNFSPYILYSFQKKFNCEKIRIIYAKKSKMDAI